MEKHTLEAVLQLLSHVVEEFYSDLEAFRKERRLFGKLGIGTWNGQGSIGWIDYLPHLDGNEEALEIVFDVEPGKNSSSAVFDISLMWSDGTLIKEYTSPYEISFANDDDLINEIAGNLSSVKDKILISMKEEMLMDRPPHYSKV